MTHTPQIIVEHHPKYCVARIKPSDRHSLSVVASYEDFGSPKAAEDAAKAKLLSSPHQ